MKRKADLFLIDDDPNVLRVLTEIFKTIGLTTHAFGSADDFLAAYRGTGPGCLVLDVRMPGLSGLELYERLRAAPVAPPTIFITGHADVRMAVEAMEGGAFGFLEKPFRMQELCDKVQEAIAWDEENWARRRRQQTFNHMRDLLTPGERRCSNWLSLATPTR